MQAPNVQPTALTAPASPLRSARRRAPVTSIRWRNGWPTRAASATADARARSAATSGIPNTGGSVRAVSSRRIPCRRISAVGGCLGDQGERSLQQSCLRLRVGQIARLHLGQIDQATLAASSASAGSGAESFASADGYSAPVVYHLTLYCRVPGISTWCPNLRDKSVDQRTHVGKVAFCAPGQSRFTRLPPQWQRCRHQANNHRQHRKTDRPAIARDKFAGAIKGVRPRATGEAIAVTARIVNKLFRRHNGVPAPGRKAIGTILSRSPRTPLRSRLQRRGWQRRCDTTAEQRGESGHCSERRGCARRFRAGSSGCVDFEQYGEVPVSNS